MGKVAEGETVTSDVGPATSLEEVLKKHADMLVDVPE